MRRSVLLTVLVAAAAGAQERAGRPSMSEEQVNELLYGLGVSMGKELDPLVLSAEELELVLTGIKDAHGRTVRQGADVGSPKIRELELARKKTRLDSEKARGAAYAEEEAKKAKVSPTRTGLVFISRAEGSGTAPGPMDTVRVHYKGTLIDGQEFDSSYRRGKTTEFALDQVIRCWGEGLQLMKPGGKATLICPSTIGYGDKGQAGIPPGATLVFEVDLVEVVKKPSSAFR